MLQTSATAAGAEVFRSAGMEPVTSGHCLSRLPDPSDVLNDPANYATTKPSTESAPPATLRAITPEPHAVFLARQTYSGHSAPMSLQPPREGKQFDMTVLLEDAPTRNGHAVATSAVSAAPSPSTSARPAAVPAAQHPLDAPSPSPPAATEGRWWTSLFKRPVNRPERTPEEKARAIARLFCLAWLLFALTASVSGNVLHAWMTAPLQVKIGAAIAAIVSPMIMLGATHLTVLLISTRRRKYRNIDLIVLVLVMIGAVGVAACAFTISFYSLRDLMLIFGQHPDVAWRWPVGVDLSMIVSSLGWLSLAEPRITETDDELGGKAPSVAAARQLDVSVIGPSTAAERELWWKEIATIVRDELIKTPKIAELTPKQLGELLQRMYDHDESGRSTGMHHREVKAIKTSADAVLARIAVMPQIEVV